VIASVGHVWAQAGSFRTSASVSGRHTLYLEDLGVQPGDFVSYYVRAREVARGVSPSRIVLAGFSQGCAVALLTGLRHGERLAGIVGLSGYLALAGTTAAERSAANQNTPIFLAHGRFDSMIALPRALATRDTLRALGYSVQWHEYPMEHSVCLPEIADLQQFLLQVLAR